METFIYFCNTNAGFLGTTIGIITLYFSIGSKTPTITQNVKINIYSRLGTKRVNNLRKKRTGGARRNKVEGGGGRHHPIATEVNLV